MYQFTVETHHEKLTLLLMECFVQCMRALIAPGTPITYDENRCVGSINRLLGKWRGSRRK